MQTGIPRIEFGRTGHASSRLIFGAAALGAVTQAEADWTLGLAFDAGVNHFDVAASYGEAEVRMKPWLASRRDEVFLATKTQKRFKAGALEELDRSLARLGTDHVDLWQMHALVDEEEWKAAMGPGGALEAFLEARKSGKVRFLGVTGPDQPPHGASRFPRPRNYRQLSASPGGSKAPSSTARAISIYFPLSPPPRPAPRNRAMTRWKPSPEAPDGKRSSPKGGA